LKFLYSPFLEKRVRAVVELKELIEDVDESMCLYPRQRARL
jgi:hypothetical protein